MAYLGHTHVLYLHIYFQRICYIIIKDPKLDSSSTTPYRQRLPMLYKINAIPTVDLIRKTRLSFGLFVDEDHSKLPTLYWLPKLHKLPYKSRFIANSSACTTTELSILLTSCLTAIKNHIIKYCTTVYERNGKNLFWSIKNSGEILDKLKSRGFLASDLVCLHMIYLLSILHCLII